MKLDTKITVKLSTADYQRLYDHSQATGIPMTRFIRTSALERLPTHEGEQIRRAG